jgi:hypothetical protein
LLKFIGQQKETKFVRRGQEQWHIYKKKLTRAMGPRERVKKKYVTDRKKMEK